MAPNTTEFNSDNTDYKAEEVEYNQIMDINLNDKDLDKLHNITIDASRIVFPKVFRK